MPPLCLGMSVEGEAVAQRLRLCSHWGPWHFHPSVLGSLRGPAARVAPNTAAGTAEAGGSRVEARGPGTPG